ncbi:MAG TPA: Trk system potassium transporter TrkA [Clostridiales bacterium]|nr:Trk system potassium transporter TrkA [Clostridiales bacterium]
MRIIIIGAGKVGYQIAESLSKESFDVIVVEQDQEVIDRINENLDVMTLKSNGLLSSTLKSIGLNREDTVIAVTESDEANMLACLSAKNLGAGTTIARIRNPEYTNDWAVTKDQLSIDYIINPEKSTANEISRMLTFSPAGAVEDFAKGKVQMVSIPIDESVKLNQIKIKDVQNMEHILVASIIRKGELIIPKGNDMIKTGDTIYIIGQRQDILKFCKSIGKTPHRVSNVMILGGGHIAYYLAENLTYMGISVKIIEKDPERCKELSEALPNSLIIKGDGTDINLLKMENIMQMDAFVALTGIDEENVMLALLAKQMGVKRVVAKVSRSNYIPLVETIGIDAAITPSMITAGEILRFIRGGRVISLMLLLGGEGEIMELDAHPDCEAVNTPLRDLDLPKDVLITAIIHKGKVIVPHGNDVVRGNDQVIVLCRTSEVNRVREMFSSTERNHKNGFWDHFKGSRTFTAS